MLLVLVLVLKSLQTVDWIILIFKRINRETCAVFKEGAWIDQLFLRRRYFHKIHSFLLFNSSNSNLKKQQQKIINLNDHNFRKGFVENKFFYLFNIPFCFNCTQCFGPEKGKYFTLENLSLVGINIYCF